MSSAILARTISELYQRKMEFTDVLFYQLIQNFKPWMKDIDPGIAPGFIFENGLFVDT
jgi:hypothetical protein